MDLEDLVCCVYQLFAIIRFEYDRFKKDQTLWDFGLDIVATGCDYHVM